MTAVLRSVNVKNKSAKEAHYERADVCAVPAAAVVGEAMLALTLADALMDKIGGDSVIEMTERFNALPHVPLEW